MRPTCAGLCSLASGIDGLTKHTVHDTQARAYRRLLFCVILWQYEVHACMIRACTSTQQPLAEPHANNPFLLLSLLLLRAYGVVAVRCVRVCAAVCRSRAAPLFSASAGMLSKRKPSSGGAPASPAKRAKTPPKVKKYTQHLCRPAGLWVYDVQLPPRVVVDEGE